VQAAAGESRGCCSIRKMQTVAVTLLLKAEHDICVWASSHLQVCCDMACYF
jgi:hypothetical protein